MITDRVQLDKEHRILALDTSQSFIVQAPAGSGKTELIIQRYLSLLTKVNSPEEILAITFTKKATNEMRSRVVLALQSSLVDVQPQSSHARLTWRLAKEVLACDHRYQWNLLNNPNQLRIQTIDSLCSYLTRQLPLLSNMGASPAIVDQPILLYREAVQEVLTHLELEHPWSAALQKLLSHLDNDLNKLNDLLIELLAKRDQWLPYMSSTQYDNDIKKQLEHHFSLVISEKLHFLKPLFPKDTVHELLSIARFAADQLAIENNESEIVLCRQLAALPSASHQNLPIWLGLAKLLLTKSKNWRKRLDKEIGFPSLTSLKNSQFYHLHVEFRERYKKLVDRLATLPMLHAALSEVFSLPGVEYDDGQWEILKALIDVLKIVVAELHLVFKQKNQIDFIENAQAALLALGEEENPTDLTLALDYQIKHILVDEFQDTSLTQYRLLEKLTLGWEAQDGRTLFIVGDPMQSIYRFREAEVGLFLRIGKYGLGNIRLKQLQLNVNFRSTTAVVEWNNRLFQTIFPTDDHVAKGAVSYHASTSQDSTLTGEIEPTIHGFVPALGQNQASAIVSIIQQIQQDSPNDTIAILVRSRFDLMDLLPVLKQADITYQAIDIEPLASKQIIQDLLSLTCALLHPADRIAWLAILRAPWCGLTLSDLHTLASHDPYVTIWERLNDSSRTNQLTEDGKLRIARMVPILKNKIEEREREPLPYWIESTWVLLGGPTSLRDYSEMNDVHAFFELLEAMHRENLSIEPDELRNKVNHLYASSTHQNEKAIQIMTIHSAKGLEFDTVILPHLESTTPSDDRSLLLYMEYPLLNNQVALLLAPIHPTGSEIDTMYEFIYQQKKIKSQFETDRLFYVATTRAKKQLHLFFDVAQNEKGEYNIPKGSFLEKMWLQLIPEIDNIFLPDTHLQPDAFQPVNPYITRLSTDWQNPVKLTPIAPIAYHQQHIGFALKDSTTALIGIVIHKILQMISVYGINWAKDISDAYIKCQFTRLGMFSSELKAATFKVREAIAHTLQDERGLWILGSHHDAKSEFAISAIVGGEVERLVLDRTFIDEQGTRWIIDYKTSTFSHQDRDIFLQQQQEKYLEKMAIYRQAMERFGNHPIRLGLYFPMLPAWREIDIIYL